LKDSRGVADYKKLLSQRKLIIEIPKNI